MPPLPPLPPIGLFCFVFLMSPVLHQCQHTAGILGFADPELPTASKIIGEHGIHKRQTHTRSNTKAPAAETPCTLPAASPDKSYFTQCPTNDKICRLKPGENVSEFTIIILRCNPGYAKFLDGHKSNNEFISTCFKGLWRPDVIRCKKICKPLPSLGLDFTCGQSRTSAPVACPNTLVEGNVVYPRCKLYYHPDRNLEYRDRYVVCQNDGNWDREFITCSPDCGKTNTGSVNLISHGQRAKPGEAPWNVAVYSLVDPKTPPAFICGGVLISVQLVLSAAHCFSDPVLHKIRDESSFLLAFGQYSRDCQTPNCNPAKKYKIKKIYFPENYIGSPTNYAADLAVVRLAEKILPNKQILPACVYWSDFLPFRPRGVTYGTLSGFGATENGTLSLELITAKLPYISYKNCLENLDWDVKDTVSQDKFCAGYRNGTGAQVGDSGGGLMFFDEKEKLYYVRGIVSHHLESSTSMAAFTDVAQYLGWITIIAQNISKSELKDETWLNLKSKI